MEGRQITAQNILEKQKIREQMFSMQTDLHISTVQRVDNITQCVLVLIAQMPTEIYVIGIFNRFTKGLWPFCIFYSFCTNNKTSH